MNPFYKWACICKNESRTKQRREVIAWTRVYSDSQSAEEWPLMTLNKKFTKFSRYVALKPRGKPCYHQHCWRRHRPLLQSACAQAWGVAAAHGRERDQRTNMTRATCRKTAVPRDSDRYTNMNIHPPVSSHLDQFYCPGWNRLYWKCHARCPRSALTRGRELWSGGNRYLQRSSEARTWATWVTRYQPALLRSCCSNPICKMPARKVYGVTKVLQESGSMIPKLGCSMDVILTLFFHAILYACVVVVLGMLLSCRCSWHAIELSLLLGCYWVVVALGMLLNLFWDWRTFWPWPQPSLLDIFLWVARQHIRIKHCNCLNATLTCLTATDVCLNHLVFVFSVTSGFFCAGGWTLSS